MAFWFPENIKKREDVKELIEKSLAEKKIIFMNL